MPGRYIGHCISLLNTLLLACLLYVPQTHADDLDLKNAWFKPTLTVHEDPVCSAFLDAAREGFLSTVAIDSWIDGTDLKQAGLEAVDISSLDTEHIDYPVPPGVAGINTSAKGFDASFIVVAGTKLYIYFHSNGGCGGACESQGVNVSTDATLAFRYMPTSSDAVETPTAESWALYRRGRDDYYLVGAVQDHIQVYRVVAPPHWKLTCDIAGAPEDLEKSANPEDRSVAASIRALEMAVTRLSGNGGGNCGSMATPSRWAFDVHNGLFQTIYRPWTLHSVGSSSENSYGDYDSNMVNLEYWATMGIYEHQALDAYRDQFAKTSAQLTKYYGNRFGWPAAQASAMADQSLKAAIARGFGFYMYLPSAGGGPDPAQPLRTAILDHLPMAQITTLSTEALKAQLPGTHENLLSVAVLYPEALRHLLEHGNDPNATNAFGKTALMYAAQYNQPESVAALLAHGADPNAATTWTTDTCDFTLQTAGMTPLHYAVRYASAGLIQLLLSNDALSFYKTDTQTGNHEYPRDWLRRYSDPTATERNPNLSQGDVAKLEELLRVPPPAELANIATDLTTRAEADYAAGKLEKSYRGLMAALSAQPGSERALADLSIVALRSGRLGPSLEASNALIAKTTSPALLASAWFNEGLACDQPGMRALTYNGKFYCVGDIIRPFLQSWKLSHSEARASKLQQFFKEDRPTTCNISQGDSSTDRYHFEFTNEPGVGKNGQVQRIYVFHPSVQHIDPTTIHWTIRLVDSGKPTLTTVVPQLVERYDLGQFSITLLESEFWAQGSVTIGDQACHPYN